MGPGQEMQQSSFLHLVFIVQKLKQLQENHPVIPRL